MLKASSYYLDDLLSQGLIYCEPSRELNFGSRRHRLCLHLTPGPTPTSRRSKAQREEWFDSWTRRKKFGRN